MKRRIRDEINNLTTTINDERNEEKKEPFKDRRQKLKVELALFENNKFLEKSLDPKANEAAYTSIVDRINNLFGPPLHIRIMPTPSPRSHSTP